jgi:putative ABC transport system permease protein
VNAGGGGASARLYRVLLLILPAWFRRRHGDAMEDAFAELHVGARHAGTGALLLLWLREAADLVRTSVALRVGRRTVPGMRRAVPRLHVVGVLRDDVQLAFRAIRRQRAFFLLAAMTLGLGVGATTAMYSALEAVVLEPLPFPDPERLVVPWRTMSSAGALISLERDEVELLRAERSVFEQIEEFSTGALTITGGDEPARVQTVKMTPRLPSLLGMQPVLGRTFSADELVGDGARVLLLSHAFWRTHFGGRRDVIGAQLRADGEAWTIVGVMPAGAARPDGDPRVVDLWLPLPERAWDRLPIARLAAGVSVQQAATRVDVLVRAQMRRPGWVGSVVPVLKPGRLHDHLRVLMIAVTLLLLVACLNVSNLLLQRAMERRMEIAVRAALGAGRARIVRQLVAESLILGGAGALLGGVFAWTMLRMLLALRPEQLEVLRAVHIDVGVLGFRVLVSACAGVLFGAIPAVRGTRTAATAAPGHGGPTSDARPGRARWLLVTAEVALSFALLVSAALVGTSLRQLAARDPGYDADSLISVDVRLPSWRYASEAARTATFEAVIADMRRVPDIRAVALASGVPPRMTIGHYGRVRLNDGPRDDSPTAFDGADIDTAFLVTIGQPLVAGRGFTRADATSPLNPVILAESAVRRLFPGVDPLGQRFSLEGDSAHTVVGVVRDIHPAGLADIVDRPLAYWALQHVRPRMTIVVRAQSTPQLLARLRQIVRTAESDAVTEIATVRELLGASLARERFTTSLLSAFAALALLLAAIGLYGVVSQVVVSRTREIGVRVALGATTAAIRRLILRDGLYATALGLAAGALLSAAGLRLLRSEVFGLAEPQTAAYVIAGLALLLVGTAAMTVPARRAARLDPVQAIRTE